MNDNKLNRLFAAARKHPAPVPAPDFAADVLRAVRREPAVAAGEPLAIFDQLNRLFPRLALAAAALIVVSLATDYGLTATDWPDLGAGVAQVSSQLLFNPEEL